MYARSLTRSIWKSVVSQLVGAIVDPRLRAASIRRTSLILSGIFLLSSVCTVVLLVGWHMGILALLWGGLLGSVLNWLVFTYILMREGLNVSGYIWWRRYPAHPREHVRKESKQVLVGLLNIGPSVALSFKIIYQSGKSFYLPHDPFTKDHNHFW